MPTPEEEAQLQQWLQQIQGAGGAGALFGGQNVAGASASADPQSAGYQQWVDQMQRAGGAQALFGANNVDATPQAQQARAAMAAEQRWNDLDSRFGQDLSWLDPSFQYSPELLGKSAGSEAYADPTAIANQNSAMSGLGALGSKNLNFQDPAVQQGLAAQWAQIQGGQGAPQFMGNGMQTGLMGQMMGQATNTGPGSLAFDNGARQQEQYGNLQGIIAGGGANAIEMANRQKQRGDEEAWLRGQREADMADYAERGLTGSGMELLALSGDRQASAGRNSLADLQTAKDLEQRRLDAINSASGLASTMRGNTIDEQSLLNQAKTSALSNATSLANSMRTQDYNELTYNDKRGLDALQQQTDLATKTRDQQLAEQIANSNAQQNALNSQGTIAGQARNASYNEASGRADAADLFSQLNQAAINTSKQQNQNVLQQGYTSMMNNRLTGGIANLTNNTGAAKSKQEFDQTENENSSSQANEVGAMDAAAFNKMLDQLRSALLGAGTNATNNQLGQDMEKNKAATEAGEWGGEAVGTIAQTALNAGSKPSGGGASAPSTSTAPTVNGGYNTNLGNVGSGLQLSQSQLDELAKLKKVTV